MTSELVHSGWNIALVGPGGAVADQELQFARAAGALLASAGCVVFTGGLDGVMAAAAEGAAAVGGTVVGLLPGSSRSGAAPGLTVAVPTGLGEGRNVLLMRAADGVLAVGGSWGTLSEIALARRMGKPVVCVGGWQVAGAPDPLEQFDRPDVAVDRLLTLLG